MSQAVTEPTADRLALLYRITQTFNSSLDLNEVLNRVIDEVIAATHAGRGFVMLLGDDGSMEFRAARGIDHRTIDDPEFQISRSVVQRVAQEGRPLLTSNAQNDAWLGGRASVMALGLRSILCVPLQHKGATRGVIYVDNTVQEGIFTERDLDLLAAIASSAAVAIENARLFREVQDNVRNLRLLNEISTDLTSTLDLERVLRASLQRAQDAFKLLLQNTQRWRLIQYANVLISHAEAQTNSRTASQVANCINSGEQRDEFLLRVGTIG